LQCGLHERRDNVCADLERRGWDWRTRSSAAVEALEDSLREALTYEALLFRVRPLSRALGAGDVPVIPGDEIPDLERKRATDDLASRVSAAHYRLLEKIDEATRWSWQPSDDPLDNFDRLEAMLAEIESTGDRGIG
jgi:hypothetical protein